MNKHPSHPQPGKEDQPLPTFEAKLPSPWRWPRSELIEGSWLSAFCNACDGTGLTESFGHNTSCPWCKDQVQLAYQSSGGILEWERYESADLTTFDWNRIGIQQTDSLQNYAEEFDDMLRAGNGLVIAGGTGAGKTHLAVGLGIVGLGTGYDVFATLLGDVLMAIRESWGESTRSNVTESRLMEKLCTVKLLILDDLGAEKPTDWAKERLAHIVNRRYTTRLPTIVTTNLTIPELETRWSSRVTSRLLGTAQLVELHDVSDYRRK